MRATPRYALLNFTTEQVLYFVPKTNRGRVRSPGLDREGDLEPGRILNMDVPPTSGFTRRASLLASWRFTATYLHGISLGQVQREEFQVIAK